jgi:hypothetical protein
MRGRLKAKIGSALSAASKLSLNLPLAGIVVRSIRLKDERAEAEGITVY